MISFLPKREILFISIAAVTGLVVLPCLNAFTPPDSPISTV